MPSDQAPCWLGYLPVIIDARVGVQVGFGHIEKRALLHQGVQMRGLDFWVEASQGIPMLLVAGNK